MRVRLLVDEALQDAIDDRSVEAGDDITTHVRSLRLAWHTDDEVMALSSPPIPLAPIAPAGWLRSKRQASRTTAWGGSVAATRQPWPSSPAPDPLPGPDGGSADRRRGVLVLATSLLTLLIILGFVAGLSGRLTTEPDTEPKVQELLERRPPSPDPGHEPQPVPPIGDEGLLEVLFLDVGQADATLLRHDEVTMLIDTGRWQRDDVVAALERAGVTELDLVVVTHPHADHLGQFDLIMDRFDVAEVWWSGSTTTSDTFERALTALENSDAAYEEPRSGDRTMVGPLRVEVLNPPVGVDLTDLHDAGIALRVTYGSVRFVFTGDAEARTEQRMVEAHGQDLAAQVLKLGHHGSGTSTHPSFLAAVAPRVAIVSAGADNPYGHPDAEILARSDAAGVDIYETASQGTIRVATDGTTVEVSTDKD